jgi:hypothetical protein
MDVSIQDAYDREFSRRRRIEEQKEVDKETYEDRKRKMEMMQRIIKAEQAEQRIGTVAGKKVGAEYKKKQSLEVDRMKERIRTTIMEDK